MHSLGLLFATQSYWISWTVTLRRCRQKSPKRVMTKRRSRWTIQSTKIRKTEINKLWATTSRHYQKNMLIQVSSVKTIVKTWTKIFKYHAYRCSCWDSWNNNGPCLQISYWCSYSDVLVLGASLVKDLRSCSFVPNLWGLSKNKSTTSQNHPQFAPISLNLHGLGTKRTRPKRYCIAWRVVIGYMF